MTLFVTAARAQTMLRDFNRHRQAVAPGDWDDIQDTWDKCERWVDLIDPNPPLDRASSEKQS